jgi:hypothetical protein
MSAGIDELEIRCALTSADTADFLHYTERHESDVPYGIHMRRNGDLRGSVYFTDKQARELFNWLGVQLHRHRP